MKLPVKPQASELHVLNLGRAQNSLEFHEIPMFGFIYLFGVFSEFLPKRKKLATLFGTGYTKWQPEMVCLDLFRVKNLFLWQTSSEAPEHQSVA